MRRHWIVMTVLLLLVLALIAVIVLWFFFPRVVSDLWLRWAENSFEDGNTERACTWYEASIWKDPDNENARVSYAKALAQEEKYSQAEEILYTGMRSQPNKAVYCMTLSYLYTTQDKLEDAVSLIEGIKEETVKKVLDDIRPTIPSPSSEPGTYHERVNLTFETTGTCYIRTDGTFPSIQDTPKDQVSLLEEGDYHIIAISVDENGLVSSVFRGEYLLEDLVFEVEFADPAMEQIVRLALNQPEEPVISTDIRALTSLSSYGQDGSLLVETPIQSLEDLTLMKNLTSLNLGNFVDKIDLTPITGLTQLQELQLSSSQLDSTDMLALSGMSGLKVLNLSKNQISTLSFLEGMEDLEVLTLNENSIVDLTSISGLTSLRELYLGFNSIEDLTPLTGMEQLQVLNLSTNRIVDISALSTLKNLTTLMLNDNTITGLVPLKVLKSLETLELANNGLAELKGLGSLTSLYRLNLSGNQIAGLSELSTLTALGELNLGNNRIVDLSPLSGMSALRYLTADKNQITSVEALSSCESLILLNVEYNQITSLEPLSSCGELQEVRAFQNPVSTIGLSDSVTVFID